MWLWWLLGCWLIAGVVVLATRSRHVEPDRLPLEAELTVLAPSS